MTQCHDSFASSTVAGFEADGGSPAAAPVVPSGTQCHDAPTPPAHAPVGHHCPITVEVNDGAVVIGLGGRLDWMTAPRLRAELLRAPARPSVIVVLDAAGTDASGTAALVAAALDCNRQSKRMVVVAPTAAEREVLTLVGVPSVAELSPDEALGAQRWADASMGTADA